MSNSSDPPDAGTAAPPSLPALEVVRFDPDLHYADFQKWITHHIPAAMGVEFLPQIGFVVEGYAMGFLYQTDSLVAQIEGLVANPAAERVARNEAIDKVVRAVIAQAREMGFKFLTGYTTLDAVMNRSKRHLFNVDPDKYYSLLRPL